MKDLRVLVVDDCQFFGMLLYDCLTSKGLAVEVADCGEQALRVLEQRRDISHVVTDMYMPGIDGDVLAQRLRSMQPGLRIYLHSASSPTAVEGIFHDLRQQQTIDGYGFKDDVTAVAAFVLGN